jgi:hypothetical protein
MNDFPMLTDAFAELERRADTAMSGHAEPTLPVAPRHRSRLSLVAASAVGVLAVSGGVAYFATAGNAQHQASGPPMTSTAHSSTVPAPSTFRIPQTPDELARRFRVVLGDTATFTVTDTGQPANITLPSPMMSSAGRALATRVNGATAKPNGAAIVGTLTASGVTGGFDLQIFRTAPGTAWCDDPDRSHCTVTRLADGSSLAIGREVLSDAGVTYLVNLIRTDGAEFLMHVSNEASPKGASNLLAAHPPLSREQLTAIVTSDRW